MGLGLLGSSCQRPRPEPEAPLPQGDSCKKTYEKLLESDPIRITVLFGYKDARPAPFVGDRYERLSFEQKLLGSCSPGENACEFHRDPQDMDLFFKDLRFVRGKNHRVQIRIMASSAGPDDRTNRDDSFQRWQSIRAEDTFHSALQSDDVVFYNGHSRDGGGPDFWPPRIYKNGHVQYAWYSKTKKGLTDMVESLKKNDQHPQLLGLFSCVSSEHFSQELHQAQKNLGLITSRRLLYYSDGLRQSYGALSVLLRLGCEDELRSAIDAQPEKNRSRLDYFFQ